MKLYLPSINLLRGLAALLVAIYHFTNYSDVHGELLPADDVVRSLGHYGLYGVYIFFVISGMVIPISLFKSNYNYRQFPRFLGRRWIRIEIPYIASIGMVLLVGLFFALNSDSSFRLEPIRLIHHITYTIPFTTYDWYNVIYWTLAIEFQFYIFMAFIYPLLVHKEKSVRFGVLFLFGSLGLLAQMDFILFHYGAPFAMGIALFLNRIQQMSKEVLLGFVLVFGIICFFTLGIEVTGFSLFTVAFIYFIDIDHKGWNWLGDISYSLYLTHGVFGGNFIYFVMDHVEGYYLRIVLIPVALGVSFLTATLVWWLIEKPAKRWSKMGKLT